PQPRAREDAQQGAHRRRHPSHLQRQRELSMAISKVVMPKLSEQMETGKIIKWLKQEGDRVQAGDILAEVETDKADVEMEAFGSGVLRKILVQAGSTVPVGGLIGVVAEPNDDIAALVSGAGGGATAAPAAKAAAGATEMASRPAAVPPQPRREDVEAAAAAGPPRGAVAAVASGVEFEDQPLSQMRAIIARRMPLSKAPVPHFYVTSEIAMDRAWALREELNALEGQPKISLNDLVIRASALTLLQHPGVNASFQGESIRVFHRAHIGVAVALEEGLITPVLRDAHAKALAQIAVEARALAERAR